MLEKGGKVEIKAKMETVQVQAPCRIPYDPAHYCTCGHSEFQHRITKGRTLKDGRVIEERQFCHVTHCACAGFRPQK